METSSKLACPVCTESVEPSDAYCSMHARALENLKDAYKVWSIGYGDISRSDFLKRLARLRETGEGAKDVARFLLENPSRWS
jgi:hypothetical protein